MTKKITSSITSWKSAALLALVAMVAAVAFSGVLTNTQNAKAQDPAPAYSVTITVGGSGKIMVPDTDTIVEGSVTDQEAITVVHSTDTTADDEDDADDEVKIYVAKTVYPGSYTLEFSAGVEEDDDTDETELKVAITVVGEQANPGGMVTVVFPTSIEGQSPDNQYVIGSDSTASGLFADAPVRPRPVIVCENDDEDCDQVTEAVAGPPALAATAVGLQIKIAKDSPVGKIYISASGTAGAAEHIIQVTLPTPARSLSFAKDPISVAASDTKTGQAVTVTVKNSSGGIVKDQKVRFVTTIGQFICGETTVPVCDRMTGATGMATAMLVGDTRPGEATITATAGNLTRKTTATFFGAAANLSVTAAGGVATVDQGKAHHVILTVTDKDGNPVKGAEPEATATTKEDDPTLVTLGFDTAYEGPVPGSSDDIQECDKTTNAAGKCAVEVSAGTPNPTATLGIHMVTATLKRTGKTALTDSLDVRVVGKADRIETNAPPRVDASSETPIKVSVYDDEGNLVGVGDVTVIKLEGRGAILGTTENKVKLAGGTATFRYYATSSDDAVALRLSIGAGPAEVTKIVEIAVGPAPEEEPSAPPATWNNELVVGQNVVVWNGPDGADPSEGVPEGVNVSAIWWYNNGAARWDGYFPEAADVPGGNTLGSLSTNQAYVVIVK